MRAQESAAPLLVHFGVVRLLPREAKHAADHSGILGCPVLVADLFPALAVLHLHIALCHGGALAVGRQDGPNPDVLHLDVQALGRRRHGAEELLAWSGHEGGLQAGHSAACLCPADPGGGGRRGQEQSERSPRTPAASPTSYERGQSVRQTPSMGSQNKCRSENVFFDLASSTLKTIWILDFTPKHVCVHMCACMCVSPLSFE